MPTYLDFNTSRNKSGIPDSKDGFRDYLIARTLNVPNGPQTFTSTNYSVQTLREMPNIDPGDVVINNTINPGEGTSRALQLTSFSNSNTFKPTQYFIEENLNVLPRRANLGLYPYFLKSDYSLIGIMSNSDYNNESELMKFAASNIRDNKQGPVLARITQNLESSTVGRVRVIDALQGNTATALNLITGREPLVEFNNRITVSSNLLGKAVDFIQTVAGTQLPFSEIPGDYLSNPRNPISNRPEPKTQAGAILQDLTGAIGSLVGIQRRPKITRKPSDLFIEYMGQGPKQVLFDQLTYSKYAPNYTTTARSQQSSKLFQFVDNIGQGIKSLVGLEAPVGKSYMGDDRSNDVKNTMSDFNDNVVKSSYYLSLMFDPIAASLFERKRNISENGSIGSNLTWISKNSKSKLGQSSISIPVDDGDGLNPNTYLRKEDIDNLQESLSTKYGFREDSILEKTQQLLDSMPKDGVASRTHVGNVIDQTSRIFKEGDMVMSRGSNIKYTDKFSGEETGVEYCRVWTKDRAYMNLSDTMKKTEIIRKFDDSVMGGGSKPWNLNIAPMSDGKKDFGASTNIKKQGDGFYAKKYMFSIENLAWKTSNTPGFTYNDLPYCERGNNGGRVMWFPPYDLKISENNSARWTDNTFLGRPEPIYTYQDTSRTGQLSFKVVVDHPSILNLLVREHFENMSDEEAENYINAFFAGCQELDFYALIRKYAQLNSDDISLIQSFLNNNKEPDMILQYMPAVESPVNVDPTNGSGGNKDPQISVENIVLKYDNDIPGPNLKTLVSPKKYSDMYQSYITLLNSTTYQASLVQELNNMNGSIDPQVIKEVGYIFGEGVGVVLVTTLPVVTLTNDEIDKQKNKLAGYFTEAQTNYETFTKTLNEIKTNLSGKTAQDITIQIESSCSSAATDDYNAKLSLRRSHSIIQDIFDKIKAPGSDPKIQWIEDIKPADKKNSDNDAVIIPELNKIILGIPIEVKKEYTFKSLGYDYEGKIIIKTANYGESFNGKGPYEECRGKEFIKTKGLKKYSPIAFYCRQSKFSVKYNNKPIPEQPKPVPTPEPVKPVTVNVPGKPSRKPAIDPMKRIIMKTLSECHYFQKLEEDSPLQFKSLKEKLKYFHPGFHSTTPEGLNARLTFMLQCIRPGDTIPVKGISDENDIDARNSSFGPPPVCVLRIGDFYHSKIIIRDVNISYEEGVWDLNPEGIGVQPMIASVTCSIAFIGGQGLSKPVERLQNALSSNFFANTEMYDERSIATNETIGGKDAKTFTKEFLQSLPQIQLQSPTADPNTNKNDINESYIAKSQNGKDLIYTQNIDEVFTNTKNYFDKYVSTYNNIVTKYGTEIGTLLLHPDYRTINKYDVYTLTSPTPGKTLQLFGLTAKGQETSKLLDGLKAGIIKFIKSSSNTYLCEMLGFDKETSGSKLSELNEKNLKPFFTKFTETVLDEIGNGNVLSELELPRNGLITSLDSVNFIVKFGKDTYVEKLKVTSSTLSGFTTDLLYKEYNTCIDYIDSNTPIMYQDLTSNINFINPNITQSDFEKIMKQLLHSNLTIFSNYLSNKPSAPYDTLLKIDNGNYPEKTIEKFIKRVEKFKEPTDAKKFKFTNFKNRKSNKEIKFATNVTAEETDAKIKEESLNVHSNNLPAKNNKLNYYRVTTKTEPQPSGLLAGEPNSLTASNVV
jgi:outer membrane protein OmpA-like peptidoglycan-associated protein